MIDILELQAERDTERAAKEAAIEKLTDRETRLKAMEIAYFEKVVEVDWLKEKLESLGATV